QPVMGDTAPPPGPPPAASPPRASGSYPTALASDEGACPRTTAPLRPWKPRQTPCGLWTRCALCSGGPPRGVVTRPAPAGVPSKRGSEVSTRIEPRCSRRPLGCAAVLALGAGVAPV